ncbi:cartilage matrix protein-like [Patella vulgata]|uniref:cartilage matrix protein-like n=1 Tax=Patella vulgata TaxID=6465 RepID=UPI0024A7F47D|nr:cartilage matrix protein-like [Patella vulgata]
MLKRIARNLTQLGEGTNTAGGISEVRKMFRLQGRSNTPHVAIVITDGFACRSPADVIFVLDGSNSIEPLDWGREKQFVAQLIASLEIGPSNINARKMSGYQGRKNTPQIVIVITDGKSRRPSDTINQAMAAKAEGITMIAVGVGSDIFVEELRDIASSQNDLFFVRDFRALR